MKKNKKYIVIGCVIVFLAIVGIILTPRIKTSIEVYNIVKSSGNCKINYCITYKDKKIENIINSIVDVNKGYMEGKKNKDKFTGTFYAGKKDNALFSMYRDSKEVLFNVKTTFDFIKNNLEDKCEFPFDKVGFLINNKYISQSQLMDLFGINTREIKIDSYTIFKIILGIEKCNIPKDINLEINKENTEFYKLKNKYTNKPLIIGILSEDNLNENDYKIYLAIENSEIKAEFIISIEGDKDIKIESPKNKFSNKEIAILKELIADLFNKIK